jgi:predicted AlkP superfamily pyrophosphatase or phosphodiesterase
LIKSLLYSDDEGRACYAYPYIWLFTEKTKFMRLFIFVFGLLSSPLVWGQQVLSRPKLVVGIVVDQMRYDFLYRYQAKYSKGGFNRMLREGFSCAQTHYNFMPTYTGPGHAAIYTGATPSLSGIVANDWFDREWGRHRYVTADTMERPVPSSVPLKVGQHSPRVLMTTTITDELRLSNNFQSKVVGVCLKDRASILPAGHIPNGAYWFDDKTGQFVTSSYYIKDGASLPAWVEAFNRRHLPDTFMLQTWTKLLDIPYRESFADWDKYDDGNYAKDLAGGGLPHDLSPIRTAEGYGVLRFTPFGNSLSLAFAQAALEGMDMGRGEATDFLCLSFSSTDYCAHQFGIHAEETQDLYLRLDRDLESFLVYLDKRYGRGNYLVFLTADHGGAETPAHLMDLDIPAGVFEESKLEVVLEGVLGRELGVSGNYIQEICNQQVYLNWDAIYDLNQDPSAVSQVITEHLRNRLGVYDAYNMEELMALPMDYPFVSAIRRGVHPRRSGDILYQLDPAWHAEDQYFKTGGTTHGSPYPYDTHVPLVWYGWGIRPGELFERVDITDIAPTLAAMLRIMEPNGNTGRVIKELFPK